MTRKLQITVPKTSGLRTSDFQALLTRTLQIGTQCPLRRQMWAARTLSS